MPTVEQLRNEAKGLEIKKYSHMNKTELIEHIVQKNPSRKRELELDRLKIDELQKKAKEIRKSGISRMSKSDLIKLILEHENNNNVQLTSQQSNNTKSTTETENSKKQQEITTKKTEKRRRKIKPTSTSENKNALATEIKNSDVTENNNSKNNNSNTAEQDTESEEGNISDAIKLLMMRKFTENNAINKVFKNFEYINEDKYAMPENLLRKLEPGITGILDNIDYPYIVRLRMDIEFEKENESTKFFIYTHLYNKFNDNIFEQIVQDIKDSIDERAGEKSGWSLKFIHSVILQIDKRKYLKASSYIELPEQIKNKKCVINVQNNDQKCFLWSVIASKFPAPHNVHRVSHYTKHEHKFNTDGIEFPMKINAVSKFERNNNLVINIFTYEWNDNNKNHDILPVRISKASQDNNDVINLLYFSKGSNSHYAWIKNFHSLVRKQLGDHRYFICYNCLSYCISEDKFRQHKELCYKNECTRIKLPEENTILQFTKYNKQMRVPYAIYADFECILQKISSCQSNPEKSSTERTHKHVASGCCYYIHSDLKEEDCNLRYYRGEDCASVFVRNLISDVTAIYNKSFKNKIPMIGTLDPYSSDTCHICEKKFNDHDQRVIDHNHFTGEIRGVAHNECNINFMDPSFIPVFFHNMSNYDIHLIIKELSKIPDAKLNIIPSTEEKYISLSFSFVIDHYIDTRKPKYFEIRFLDSFRFLSSSLEALCETMPEFKILPKYFNNADLLTRKGIYCYEYVDNFQKFNETELPPREKFYSSLNEEEVSEDDYNHAQKIWKTFAIKTLGEYHDLYLKSDVVLLADIFQNFRVICMQHYKLDPCWYYTSPGLAFDALLKHSKVQLQLLSDPDMLLFFENQVRGGISTITKRYCKANNKYMKDYNPKEESSFLIYLDSNNLYGWSMSQYLPVGEFKWLSNSEIAQLDIHKLTPTDDYGYVMDVDVKYPEKLHDCHNDFPFLAEQITINKNKKLIPNLRDKQNYIVHYLTLQQAIENGLELTKINRVIQFKQSPWMHSYINMNTKLRKSATSAFKRAFYKLMNNAVYGRTLMNVRKHVDIRLVTNETDALKLTSKPNYKRRTIFSETLAAVHMKKTSICYKSPVYVGSSILDISKTLMYDFFYKYLKVKFNCNLLFTDTDSFLVELKTDDYYKNIAPDVKQWFDTSCYNSSFGNIELGVNKKVLGMFKDETGNKIITSFVGLRSKMYSYVCDGEEHKRAKGIKKCVIKKRLKYDDYMKCLESKHYVMKDMSLIRSEKHELYTLILNKIALSCNDDKRIVLPNGINTLAYGHYSSKNK